MCIAPRSHLMFARARFCGWLQRHHDDLATDRSSFACPWHVHNTWVGAVATTRRHRIEDGDGAKEDAGDTHDVDDGKDDSGESLPDALSLSRRVLVHIFLNPPKLGTRSSDYSFLPEREHPMRPFEFPNHGCFFRGKWKCAPWRGNEGIWAYYPFSRCFEKVLSQPSHSLDN